MEHHQRLPVQETCHCSLQWTQGTLFVTFDLLLVPVAQEHSVDVVGEVRRGEEDVGICQPVPEERGDRCVSTVSQSGGSNLIT